MKKKIYLIRHCRANGQEAEAPLTVEGEVQAVSLSAFLTDKNIKEIYSSPYKRAVDSISPFAGQNRLNITIDRRLEERILSKENLHDWMDKLSQTFVDKTLCYGGGESSHYAASRGLAVIRDFLDGPFQTAAIVSHGNLISLILNHFDETFGFEQWKTLSNPDVYLMEFEGSTPAIRRVWDGL